MSPQERNKQNFQKLFDEVMNRGNFDAADDLITVDRPDHNPNMPPQFAKGREGFKSFFRMFRAGVPDLKFTTELMIAEGDMVAVYGFAEGTHSGEFMGIPATGKSFKVTNSDFCRFNSEGKITDHWGVFDSMGMMRQIGMVPASGQHA